MPTTDRPTLSSSIVSPSPHLSRKKSFTMATFTSITAIDFKFGDHPLCPLFSSSLNDTYSEPFEQGVIDSIFTDNTKTTVAPDVVPLLHAAIIDVIMISTTAAQTVVAPIINSVLLFAYAGHLLCKFPI